MFTRMLKLRLLNAVAPAYFFMATAVTFILHFGFFIPTIFPNPDTSLRSSTMLHTAVFLFLMFNALGNYIMTIKYPAESANETAVPVCSPHCSDKVDAHYLLNGRHFCKLCKKVILKRDHHCFFTGNCIGNKNMRYFIMFCIYTSCTCLYSLVLGVAFLTVEYSISFENPLTFLTLLPLSAGYFFMVSPHRNHLRLAVVPGADAVCVAGHRSGLCRFLLPAGAAGGPRTDLVSAAERTASGQPQPLESQPKGCFRYPLDSRPYPASADSGDVL
uniref:Palmitoyltransferase n=1 Tax=Amphiprion ocellaris TaxID=80972 RepID=A0A3Q1C9R0_AMPOC